MSVYVGTQTFQKHMIWGYALIGLFQIVLGAQALRLEPSHFCC